MWEWWHPGGAPNRECQPGVPNLPAHIGNTTTQQIITQHILIFLAVQTFFVVIFLSGANIYIDIDNFADKWKNADISDLDNFFQ